MSNFHQVVQGVMGGGLLTLLLALAGTFSTILNGLQILNGLVCFSKVSVASSVTDSDVSSFSISGYGDNHYFNILNGPCSNFTDFTVHEPHPFCTNYGVYPAVRFVCTQSTNQSRVSYKYVLEVDCTRNMSNSHTFEVSVSPGSTSLRGVGGYAMGFLAFSSVETQRCQLSRLFYFQFSVVCAGITLFIFLVRALMRTTLVELVSFRLSTSERFYWLYEAFKRYGFFSFFNPYNNEPYHLIKGEKFYNMVYVPPSSEGSMDLESCTLEELCLESFTWSASDSVYKFSYDVAGETVFAYSKDKLGIEKLKEKEKNRTVVAEIRKYLRLKAKSVCILTNDDVNIFERHFLSLSEVYSLAKADYRLEEEISDNDYRLYSKRQNSSPFKPGNSRKGSRQLGRENSDIPLRTPGSSDTTQKPSVYCN